MTAAKKRAKPVGLDPDDIAVDRQWTRTGGRNGKATQTSRADGLQSGMMRLTHRPTNIRVEGLVAEGHYSRGEMTAAMNVVHEQLLAELTMLVAKHLRLPGR
jgi:hypothetical protein